MHKCYYFFLLKYNWKRSYEECIWKTAIASSHAKIKMLTDIIDDCFMAEYKIYFFLAPVQKSDSFSRPGSGAGYVAQKYMDPDPVG